MSDILAISLLIGALVALIILFIYSLRLPKKVSIRDRGIDPAAGRTKYVYSKSKFGTFYRTGFNRIVPESTAAKLGAFLGLDLNLLQERIVKAGCQDRISALEICVLKLLSFVALGCGILLFLSTRSVFVLMGTSFVFVFLFIVPAASVSDKLKEKISEIRSQIPTFIEQTYLCISAGTNIEEALKTVTYSIGGPLGKAFSKAFADAAYAGDWRTELSHMAVGLQIDELEDFINNITVADRKGVNIEDTLRNEVAHINRINKSRVMGEIKSLDAKLSPLQIVFCLIPMMVIVMLPVMIQILETM